MSQLSSRRTLIQRAQAIFGLLEENNEPIPKSKLKDVGLNPNTAEKWLDLIMYIQQQPLIRLVKTESNTIVVKVEGRYHAMSRRAFQDSDLTYEQRLRSIDSYLRALVARELTLDDAPPHRLPSEE
jgi:hypothetical protein